MAFAYEVAAGSALAGVESMQRSYTSAGTFDTASTPSLAQVGDFLSWGSAEIATMLLAGGYAEVQSDTTVLRHLMQLNIRAACWWVELSRPSAGFTNEEPNARVTAFGTWKRDAVKLFRSDAFDLMGATKAREHSRAMSHGGTSISDKTTLETDADFEPYAFNTDLHKDPGRAANAQSRRQEQ